MLQALVMKSGWSPNFVVQILQAEQLLLHPHVDALVVRSSLLWILALQSRVQSLAPLPIKSLTFPQSLPLPARSA